VNGEHCHQSRAEPPTGPTQLSRGRPTTS
jgi:hypothetical protein